MKRRLMPVLIAMVMAAACRSPASAPPAASPATVGATLPQPMTGPTLTAAPDDVHRAEGAGQWYPEDAAKLRAAVEAYLRQAEVQPIPGRLVAVIVPHAGYAYSGAVAGYAYRALQAPDGARGQASGCAGGTLAVIGDTHSGHGSAPIAVWAAGAFETPLGALAVDEEVGRALLAADGRFRFDRAAFQGEHPVENQLPFIQVACPGARIVPIVIREPTLENAQVLATALVAAFGDRPALIVASTDLSHYFPYEQAWQIDQVALQAIASLDPQAVADSPRRCTELGIADNPLTMCSQGAVMTALIAARLMGANQATLLIHATSGDTPLGERDQVVGYGAVALWQGQNGPNPAVESEVSAAPTAPAEPLVVSPQGQAELLALARRAALDYLTTETFAAFSTTDPALLQPLGAYVTYRTRGSGDLRGCIGRLEGDRPAYLNVQYAAVAAAVGDPRFPPVTVEELNDLTIEITLIYPLQAVQGPDEIDIGRHGVLMRLGEDGRQGALFLPQVMIQEGWDLQATLVNLCRKAGLTDDNCWRRPDAHFQVFGGQWFGEGE